MNNGQKFSNVVGAKEGTKVEDLLTCSEINAAIFHRSGISTAGGVNGNGVSFHFMRQRQDGIVSVRWRIYKLFARCSLFCRSVGGCSFLISCCSFFRCRERFVFGICVSFDLHLAFCPGIVNTGLLPIPDYIIFLFRCHQIVVPPRYAYILSGISMPSRPIPVRTTLATFSEMTRRNCLHPVFSSCRML